MLMRLIVLEKDADQNVHLSAREQSSRFQGRKGLGILSPLRKRRMGLHGKAYDALLFPEPSCAEKQKQAGAARVLEGEQEDVGDV